MNTCIFCKIIAQEIPSYRVYEDADVYAFLDIHPVHPGHTLVVPKVHAATLLEIQEEALAKTVRALPKIAAAVMKVTGAQGFNLTQNNGEAAGQSVHHLHFHIIPRYTADGLQAWPQGAYAEIEEAQKMAANIQEKIKA